MPTSSSDKELIINEPEAVDKLLDLLLASAEKLKVNREIISPEAIAKSDAV